MNLHLPLLVESTPLEAVPAHLGEPAVLVRRLIAHLRQFSSAIVAYSGGVDSTVVLAAAHAAMGERALGCIGLSPSFAERELRHARQTASQIGARYRVIETHEHLDARYAANPGNRCYFCKSELYTILTQLALGEGFAVVLDGTNASDLGGHRPGYAAARERGVRSPLAELDLDKAAVRAIAREMGLDVWDKPAAPCLASRVPTGTAIEPALLKQIERAEDVLAGLGFREYRVRHHGEVARCEVAGDELSRALALRDDIVSGIKEAGYRFVALDLAGFRSGSLSASN